MELDYQKIYHNFITKIVIFSIFLYKDQRKDEKLYEKCVKEFIYKRIKHDIELHLEVGPKMSKEEERDLSLKILLDDFDKGILNLVVVHFKTGVKEISLQIDINQEEKYEKFLYG